MGKKSEMKFIYCDQIKNMIKSQAPSKKKETNTNTNQLHKLLEKVRSSSIKHEDSIDYEIPLYQCDPEKILSKTGLSQDGIICHKCGNIYTTAGCYENHIRNCGRIKSRLPPSAKITLNVTNQHIGPTELNFDS